MLKLNLNRLFKIRAIEKRQKYLMDKGIPYNSAYHLCRDTMRKYDIGIIEQLCYALNCTPNDLFDFIPDKEHLKDERLELHKMKKADMNEDEMDSILKNYPVKKVAELIQKIKEEPN
jgi:DNA-binding Xre family transcriptional regulator